MGNKLMRVSTPTLIYYIDDANFDMTTVAKARFIVQNAGGENRIIHENPEIDVEEKSFTTDLSQEETRALKPGTIEVQVHIKTTSGRVIWTDIIQTKINRVTEDNLL